MTELPDMLTDDRIIEIAKKYAQDLAVSYLDITTAPVIDFDGRRDDRDHFYARARFVGGDGGSSGASRVAVDQGACGRG